MRLYSVLAAGLLVAPVAVSELIQVQVVMRAGARKYIPVGEPRLEIGAPLLPEGYVAMEGLGKLLRNRYLVPGADVPLANVTGTYKSGDTLVRTISRDQTASSANAFVYGLYPPVTSTFLDSKRPLSNGHQDVPVFTISRGIDNILSAYAVCPKLEENIAGFFNSTAFHAKANETLHAREYLAGNYNMSKELYYMPFIYDRALVNRKYRDEAAKGHYPINETMFLKLKEMADFVESGKFDNEVAGNLCGGPLLGEIFERLTLAMYGDKTRSNAFLGYVGTHPTMACLVGAMNLSDPILDTQIVPYASALIFELHRIGTQHYLQLLYHEGNSTTFRTLPLGHKGGPCEDDSTLCAVEDARSLLKDAMQPSLIDWCDSCEAYFMPACNQAAQIKLAEIISADEEVTKKTRRRGTINTVGAAFIGVFCGALFALFVREGVPAIRRKLASRQGRNYSPADDEHGIEAPERAGDAI